MSVDCDARSPQEHPEELPPSMVGRMSLILDAFTTPTSRLTLEAVVRHTGLPRSTTHRILDQLVSLGWLVHGSTAYSLGPRALRFGGHDGGEAVLRAVSAPHLHELLLETGLVAHLAVLDGARVRYLDKLGGRLVNKVPSRVGGYSAAHATALGKAMLSVLPPEEVDSRLSPGIARFTLRTISDMHVLHQELHRIRGRGGIAYERGEVHPRVACVAVAVRGPDGPVGAISLSGDLNAPLERFGPRVRDAARRTADDLFGIQEAGNQELADAVGPASDSWSDATLDRLVADAFGAWG